MKKICVAIDGPAGAGKSTIAKIVADRLNYKYLDTGAMYRAVCWAAKNAGVSFVDEKGLAGVVENLQLNLDYSRGATEVFVGSSNITNEIRSLEISNAVSIVAQSASVRIALVALQRRLSSAGGVVVDGRDIGTVVLPYAELKIFLTASVEERARRRWLELTDSGVEIEFAELKKTIEARDYTDSNRAISPLSKAIDAIEIDTTGMSIADVSKKICDLCEAIC
ncbi:MAG: (d)CMP kinase [Negativicutes bacterium]